MSLFVSTNQYAAILNESTIDYGNSFYFNTIFTNYCVYNKYFYRAIAVDSVETRWTVNQCILGSHPGSRTFFYHFLFFCFFFFRHYYYRAHSKLMSLLRFYFFGNYDAQASSALVVYCSTVVIYIYNTYKIYRWNFFRVGHMVGSFPLICFDFLRSAVEKAHDISVYHGKSTDAARQISP